MTAADALYEKSAHDLEWSRLLEHLAGRCLGPAGGARLRARRPAETHAAARGMGELTAEALDAFEAGAAPPTAPSDDLSPILGRVNRGAVASGVELATVLRQLEGARRLRAWAHGARHRWPKLARALESPEELEPVCSELARCIEDDGNVADRASPELARARRAVGEAQKELTTRLSGLVRRYSDVLSDDYWTEREGRYVLPVRSDSHVKVQGIVFGSSASGATLFVEPAEITGLGNRLKVALAEVEREEARVLSRLSAELSAVTEAVSAAQAAITEADVLGALTSWARDTRSIAMVVEPEAKLQLLGARHPLLLVQGVEVVDNDVHAESGRALVVSGPNAGGKTVALKCLGLAVWMARSGIPVPVEPGSVVGWFSPVLTDVGDEQSLLQSLSTFSAHIKNIAAILEAATTTALVLLDEVAAGTDPEEGAALATSVIQGLLDRGAAVAVTTHYERLKELAAEDSRFENASVGFDLAAMAPTFRMTMGIAGASSALAVAQRFGIPEGIIARARASMPDESVSREDLLRELSSESERLKQARLELERELGEQRRLTQEAERERARAREQEKNRLAREGRELTQEVREARARLLALKKRLGSAELREAEKVVSDAARHVALGGELADVGRVAPSDTPEVVESELVVGARVLVPRLGTVAEVAALPERGQVRVIAGAMRLMVPVSELRRAPGGARRPATERKKREPTPKLESRDGFVPVRTRDNTLNLRGKRVDEALDELDAFVDTLLRDGERAAFVLHGHGTGALKLAVRAHLGAHSQIRRAVPAEPEDGGDAFTLLWLRD
ncbi:MAG: Smr/MutS family protein [Polyangiaceae bacterium]|nr:Smr/MutS family protein [Polyangiaceae bacterium]